MAHPFERIKAERRGKYFYASLAGTLLLLVVMNLIGEPLNTTTAPYGVVSFEFAGTSENARAMMESWGSQGLARAAFIQGLDFLFPLAYASAISMGCILAGGVLEARKWPLAKLGGAFAWGLCLAAGLDYVENAALAALLFGTQGTSWAMLAAVCAAVKFILIFLGMVYALYGLIIRLVIPKTGI